MREIKTQFDKNLSKNIRTIKKAVFNLRAMGNLTIEIQPTETMIGNIVNHIYVRDRMNGKIILQKYLLTIE
jgi:hypothetical protein